MASEQVILVDAQDNVIGTSEKLQAHQEGKLHRAFSVFLFDKEGRLLLQQRARSKYHSGGLWSNTCCSHPRPGEEIEDAAQRRLLEEVGFDCPLRYTFGFVYKAKLSNGLIEHEFDHVLVGVTDQQPVANAEEAAGYAWKSIADLKKDIAKHPDRYTPWLKIAMEKWEEHRAK